MLQCYCWVTSAMCLIIYNCIAFWSVVFLTRVQERLLILYWYSNFKFWTPSVNCNEIVAMKIFVNPDNSKSNNKKTIAPSNNKSHWTIQFVYSSQCRNMMWLANDLGQYFICVCVCLAFLFRVWISIILLYSHFFICVKLHDKSISTFPSK